MSKKDVISDVPPDTSSSSSKSLGRGGGGMSDNPGVVSNTPFKRPNVGRSDILKNSVHVGVKSGLTIRNSETKSSFRRSAGSPPGGKSTPGKEPVK